MIKKYKAFTLMEMLISLMVIGVALAILGKTVGGSFAKNALYEGFKGAYKGLDQATLVIIQQNRGSLVNVFINDNTMMNIYCNQMQCLHTCYPGQGQNTCFDDTTSSWTDLNYSAGWQDRTNHARAILGNGDLVLFNAISSNCTDSSYVYNSKNINCGSLYVDVNGFNPPNAEGRDIFEFEVTNLGIMPAGVINAVNNISPWTAANSTCNPGSTSTANGSGCGGRLLMDGSMDY